MLCPPGFYATAIQVLNQETASGLGLECISIPACADPPPPPSRSIKIHYRAPGCGPRRSRRSLRGLGSELAAEDPDSRLSSGSQQESNGQLRSSTAAGGSARVRSSSRMLGSATDVGAIVGNAFVLSTARLTDGAGNTVDQLAVYFGDPSSPDLQTKVVIRLNSEWVDGFSVPDYRFDCPSGFSAVRAQTGGMSQPPTRVGFRCGSDAAAAGGWTSPELGVGDYGPAVPLSEVQCPEGSRLAGLLASTRRIWDGGPLLVEAFTAYCTKACAA